MSGLPNKPASMPTFLRNNALSMVLFVCFVTLLLAQTWTGWRAYDADEKELGHAAISLGEYVRTGHFVEATFENWESEFLQMGVFVLLAVKLRQRGSTESKGLEEKDETDEDPRRHRNEPGVPWPVRKGGWILWLYERSLSIAFFFLFAVSFAMHAWGGWLKTNAELFEKGRPGQTFLEFALSSEFWFESFQNWQSEFLAMFALVVLTIFLRQRGSPQSKPVAARHGDTG